MKTSRMSARVRYADTDRMGTVYHARYFEWFELGRSQYLRDVGLPYAELEGKGVFLPVIEASCRYLASPGYDDVLTIETTLDLPLRPRCVFRYRLLDADASTELANGWTAHALVNARRKPIRPPQWLSQAISAATAGDWAVPRLDEQAPDKSRKG
ncbi:MAG: thioesterase family protein [Planctomycetota bacterium]